MNAESHVDALLASFRTELTEPLRERLVAEFMREYGPEKFMPGFAERANKVLCSLGPKPLKCEVFNVLKNVSDWYLCDA